MKKLLLSVVGILFAATSFAQTLVASLSHGTDITYYYGVNACSQAVTAAASGDIITLSGGVFNAASITKGITIRGAGIDSTEPTYFINDFNIEIPSTDPNRFMMEGIKCTGEMYLMGTYANPYFLKCQFNIVDNYRSSTAITNIMFVNCKITGSYTARGSSSFSFVNCFINNTTHNDNASATAANCVFAEPSGYHISSYHRFNFYNCIFVSLNGKGGYNDGSGNTNYLPATCQAQNCYTVNFPDAYDAFYQLSIKNNCPTNSLAYATVFKTYNGTYSDTETFELTDAAKTAYLGTDGKQIGMYGGAQPYTSVPSYPLITTMTVGEETDANGQLSVTIATNK